MMAVVSPSESDASRRETYTRSRFRYPLFGFPTAFDDLYTVLSFILCDSSTVARDAKGDCGRRSVADDATFDDSAFLDLPATRRGGGCSRAKEKARDGRLAEMRTRNMISGEKKHKGHD